MNPTRRGTEATDSTTEPTIGADDTNPSRR